MDGSREFGEKTVGEIVAEDYRLAKVFERNGIDFCCGGNIKLSVACSERGISVAEIAAQIDEIKRTPADRSQNYNAWDLSFLADFIVNTHHAYLNENLVQIAADAHRINSVHGANHPELATISSIFDKVVVDMVAHLREEEQVLFPAVKRLESNTRSGALIEESDRSLIRDSIEKLSLEHDEVGDSVHEIRRLSREYSLPADACNTYAVTYKKLQEFEDDLHKHVHLENNILFPKVMALL